MRQILRFLDLMTQMLKLVWKAYPLAYVGTILMTLVQGLLPLGSAWVTKTLLDWLTLKLGNHEPIPSQHLMLLLALQGVFLVATLMLPQISRYLSAESGRRLTEIVQGAIFRKLNSFSGIAPFETPQTYDTIRLAQHGAEYSTTQILPAIVELLQNTVVLTSFVGVLYLFNPFLANLVLFAALPQLLVQLKLGQQRFDMTMDLSPVERRKFYYSFLLASAQAAKEVRLFGLGQHFHDRLMTLYRKSNRVERRQQQRELRWELGAGLFSSIVTTAAFVVVVFTAFSGRLSVGDISLYLNAVNAVQESLAGAVMAIANLAESVMFFSQYQKLLALPCESMQPLPARPIPPLTSGLELRRVSFRYSDTLPWILRDVNLQILPGECLALVGLNGAGKTTLIKLLTRLYEPCEGQILWNGIDIREFAPEDYRQHIGVILQDFLRYDFSVSENIGLGELANVSSQTAIEQAARQAHVHEEIMRLPQGYQTELSRTFMEETEGVDLSGGQWQKVATARLFMRNADLLVLDEPTSALDPQAEYEAYQHFAQLTAGRTSLLISHRFSTVRMADRIAVLDGGCITETGTHEALIKSGGAYAHLYRLQADCYTVPAH